MLQPSQSNWIVTLLTEYMVARHIEATLINMYDVISFNEVALLVKWMKARGFAVEYWEVRSSKIFNEWSWGVEIADNCPLLMEYRLKGF